MTMHHTFSFARLRPVTAALALLALGGTASAQSSVTLYGLFDVSASVSRAPGGSSMNSVDSGKMTTSYLGLRGSEDLGGGLSALFKLEHFLRADTGEAARSGTDPFWSRTAHVGLSGAQWGTLTLGRNTTPLFVATLAYNAFGDSFGYSPSIRHYFTSGTTTGDSGWSDSFVYSSPRFGGVSVGLSGSLGEGSNGRNWGANVSYAGGPVGASLVYQEVKKDGTAAIADTRTSQLGLSYDFSVVKAFGQYGYVHNLTTTRSYHIAGLGARVPVTTAGAVLAQWGRITPDSGARRNTLSLGYDHNLSKRTDVYLVGMRDKVENLSTGLSVSVGVRHRF
jgi:predicted porin